MHSSHHLISMILICALAAPGARTFAQNLSNSQRKIDNLASLRSKVEEQQKALNDAPTPDAHLAAAKELSSLQIELADALAAAGVYAEAGDWYARANQLREESYQIEKAKLEEEIKSLQNLSDTRRSEATLSESDRANFIKTNQLLIDGLLNALDLLARERNDLSTRTAIAERRLALARESKDPGTIATALDATADMLWKAGDLIAARTMAEEALQFRRKDPRQKYIYDTVRLLAWIAHDANDWREAEARYRECIAMAKPGALPDLFDLALELNDHNRHTKGRMNIADRLNREETALHARLYLADIDEKKGNYGEADREYKSIGGEISRLYASGADDEPDLLALMAQRDNPRADLIDRLSSQIKIDDIIAHRSSKGATTTEDELNRLQTADHFVKTLCAELAIKYATLLADQGEFDKAAQAYRDAITLFQNALGGAFPAVGLYSVLGRTERQRGDFEAAEAALKTALTIYRRQHNLSGIAAVLGEQSALCLDQNHVAEAKALAEDALKIARMLSSRTQIAGLLRALGRAESEAGGDQLKSSEQHLREALATWRDLGLRAHTAYTLSSLGLTLERQGRIKEALDVYEEAVKLIELLTTNISSNVGAGVFNSSTGNRELYDRLIRLLIKIGRTSDALAYLERAKSKALVNALAGAKVKTPNPALNLLLTDVERLGDSVTVAETTLSAAASSSRPNAQKVGLARKQATDTERHYLQAINIIEQANPFYASLVAVTPTNLIEVRRHLPEKTALIEYFPADSELYIFVVTAGKPPLVRRSSIGRAELAGLIAQYRRAIAVIEDPYTGGADSVQTNKRNRFWVDDGTEEFKKFVSPIKNLTDRLYDTLITPIESDIDRADTLVIVPAAELYYLPIHALGRIKAGGDLEFLIEKKRIAYLSSADLLNVVTSIKQNYTTPKSATSGVLALGNPDGSLDAATEEVDTLRRAFPNTAVYMKDEATLAHFREAVGRARYIHFATHGILEADPKESYLLLAGEPNKLSVRALVENTYGLSFAGTEIATLSACTTNLGGFDPGAKYSSLSRAFAKAGAPTVVASLWKVDDNSTRDTMAGFYKQLAAGQPKGEALRRAQLAVMHNPEFAHPYYWSAFVLMGDWR